MNQLYLYEYLVPLELPSPLPSHPSRSSQPRAELLVLRSNLLLAIYFIPGSIYMLLSQFTSLSPSPTVSTCLFESIFLKGEMRVWPIFSSVDVSIDSGRGSWMFGKWNDLNQWRDLEMHGSRLVEQSYKVVVPRDLSYSTQFLQWPHTAQHVVGAQQISMRQV